MTVTVSGPILLEIPLTTFNLTFRVEFGLNEDGRRHKMKANLGAHHDREIQEEQTVVAKPLRIVREISKGSMVRSEQQNAIPKRETETQGGQVEWAWREATTVAATLVRRPLMGDSHLSLLAEASLSERLSVSLWVGVSVVLPAAVLPSRVVAITTVTSPLRVGRWACHTGGRMYGTPLRRRLIWLLSPPLPDGHADGRASGRAGRVNRYECQTGKPPTQRGAGAQTSRASKYRATPLLAIGHRQRLAMNVTAREIYHITHQTLDNDRTKHGRPQIRAHIIHHALDDGRAAHGRPLVI
ncbi:hypothetical protein BC827DRAFT_1387017 [Russula dissimulans]|nr:hypothetical protein BC827DRAFT_1387017 [Russula dissimulans]